MRWSNLTIDGAEQHALPGYRDAAVVRRFDAPEALDTRFYEVRAKSALNRVPEQSRMPFRWTVNPYRGCTHACVYCLSGETPILMADGRHRPLRDCGVGDAIYGTRRDGPYRRYAATEVLAKWAVVKPAYRVALDDGTELIAGGDHRFLSAEGWRHVVDSDAAGAPRPHLEIGATLVGTGRFATQPLADESYQRGYLSGLLRREHYGRPLRRRPRRARGHREAAELRWTITDDRALTRARLYLDALQLSGPAAAGAIAVAVRPDQQRVSELMRWPEVPDLEWFRGFLAASFDVGGSRTDRALRIASADPRRLRWVEACLRRLGFDVAHYRTRSEGGLAHLRVRGALPEHLRFLHLTDPAITDRRSIEGQIAKARPHLRVAEIESLGPLPLYDITTGTHDFIADGVVSHNCFARPTHTYLDFNAGRDFEREIVVKVNAPEVLRAELARPSWTGEHVAMGTNTDPYQWVEGRYRLMRGIWEALRDHANPCSVLTKSPLLLRDLDLLREIAQRTAISANLSVPTLDERAWRQTEPRTPHPRARLEAVAALNAAGIPTGVLIAPLMPGINDQPRQIERILELATEAGAETIGGVALHLRGEVREVFMSWLRAARPDLVERYEELYRRGAYAPPQERRRLAKLVRRGPFMPGVRRIRDPQVPDGPLARVARTPDGVADGPGPPAWGDERPRRRPSAADDEQIPLF